MFGLEKKRTHLPKNIVARGIIWFWDRAKLNPLFYSAVATVAAIIVADSIGWEERWKWLLLFAISLPALLRWKNPGFLIAAIAAFFAVVHTTRLQKAAAVAPLLPGTISTTGTISGSTQKPADSGATLFRLTTESIGSFLVRVDEGGRNLKAGDQVEITGDLIPPRARRNPNEFDFPRFLHRNGLRGKIKVADDLSINLLKHQPSHFGLEQLAERCRTWLSNSITSGIDPDSNSAAIIKSMVLGASDASPPELEHPFRYSGTMHLFAISGLHVGIFTSILWFALRLLNVRKDHAALLLIPAVFFYAFITGWRPSAVRAAVMLSVVCIGAASNRHPRLFNSLGAAAMSVL
ncbi:MAG: ComEC/Rec2 family competence protein, partial [Verrucomicrobiales bacterium]|nr:ComEC/Rec2 family competence protein [Verrucomicrobiales bacterium]